MYVLANQCFTSFARKWLRSLRESSYLRSCRMHPPRHECDKSFVASLTLPMANRGLVIPNARCIVEVGIGQDEKARALNQADRFPKLTDIRKSRIE